MGERARNLPEINTYNVKHITVFHEHAIIKSIVFAFELINILTTKPLILQSRSFYALQPLVTSLLVQAVKRGYIILFWR